MISIEAESRENIAINVFIDYKVLNVRNSCQRHKFQMNNLVDSILFALLNHSIRCLRRDVVDFNNFQIHPHARLWQNSLNIIL